MEARAAMNLFFETANQAGCFLAAVPIGFITAIGLDLGKREGVARFLLDVLVLAATGIALVVLLLLRREESLRLYHMLGLGVGALLYYSGIGKLGRLTRSKKQKKKNEKPHSVQESEPFVKNI